MTHFEPIAAQVLKKDCIVAGPIVNVIEMPFHKNNPRIYTSSETFIFGNQALVNKTKLKFITCLVICKNDHCVLPA